MPLPLQLTCALLSRRAETSSNIERNGCDARCALQLDRGCEWAAGQVQCLLTPRVNLRPAFVCDPPPGAEAHAAVALYFITQRDKHHYGCARVAAMRAVDLAPGNALFAARLVKVRALLARFPSKPLGTHLPGVGFVSMVSLPARARARTGRRPCTRAAAPAATRASETGAFSAPSPLRATSCRCCAAPAASSPCTAPVPARPRRGGNTSPCAASRASPSPKRAPHCSRRRRQRRLRRHLRRPELWETAGERLGLPQQHVDARED